MPLTPPPSAPPAAPAAPGDAPSRANPSSFRSLADAFVVWQVGFRNSVADLRAWLAGFISWAAAHVTEMDALQSDVSSKQLISSVAASAASDSASAASGSASAAAASRTAIDDRIYPGTYDPVNPPTTKPISGNLSANGDEFSGTDGYRYARIGGAWMNQTAAAAGSAAAASASQVAAAESANLAAASQAQVAIYASAALASGKIFSIGNTAAGIAATSSGEAFMLLTASLQVFDVYLNTAGVAVLQGQHRVADGTQYKSSAGRDLQEWRDALGNVYGRVTSAGLLMLAGLSTAVQTAILALQSLVSSDTSSDLWRVKDSAGKVLARLRPDGNLYLPLMARSVQAQFSYLFSLLTGGTRVFYPETYGAVGDGVTDDTSALQACADAVSAAGGGVLQLASLPYLHSVPIYIRSNTTVQGMGWKSQLKAKSGGVTYGPTSAGSATTFANLWLADSVDLAAGTTTAPSNVAVRDLRCTPLESVNGSTGYNVPITMGVFLGRLASGQIAKNVMVDHVYVDDCGIGIGLGQRGTPTADVAVTDLHQNLWVKNCRVEKSRNKAIELQQTYGSGITDNVAFNCNHGPQFIHQNQSFTLTGNFVEFNDYAFGIANACHGGTVANNRARFSGNFPNAGTGVFPYNYTSFSSYPVGFNFKVDWDTAYTGTQYIEDVEFSNNVIDMTARGAGDGRAWSFGGNASAQNIAWRRLTFKGDKYINCKPQIGRGIENDPISFTISDIRLEGCTMPGFIGSDSASVSDVTIKGGKVSAAQTLDNAAGWEISSVKFAGTLTLSATTSSCKVVFNTLPAGAASITNNGAGNTVSNNV